MASTRLRRLAVLAAGMAVALLVPASPAAAQLDPGNFDIRQHGTVVGHIFVPVHLSPAVYVEHWIVSREYVYPSSHAPVVTEIVPSTRSSASEQEFFRQVDFGPGSRYIRVLAQETGTLPKAGGAQARADHAGLLGVGQVPVWAVAATVGLAWRLTARSSTANRSTPQRRTAGTGTPKFIGMHLPRPPFPSSPRWRNEHLLTAYRPPEHSASRRVRPAVDEMTPLSRAIQGRWRSVGRANRKSIVRSTQDGFEEVASPDYTYP